MEPHRHALPLLRRASSHACAHVPELPLNRQESLIFGSGDGSFANPVPLTFPADDIALGDLDGDGRPELAGVYTPYQSRLDLQVSHNEGARVFGAATSYSSGVYAHTLGERDMNGDGFLDVIVAGGSQPGYNGFVTIFLNNGKGHLPAVGANLSAGSVDATSVLLGDVDGDGNADIVVTGSAAVVFLGRGDGTFGAGTDSPLPSAYSHAVTADFDGDGRADVAVTDATNDTVNLLFGKKDGTLSAPTSFPIDAGSGLTLAAGDIDGDGHPDVAVAGGTTIEILLGDGQGHLAKSKSLYVSTGCVGTYHGEGAGLAMGDFNGDGVTDFVCLAQSPAASVSAILGCP
ncbi:MAG TPA: VCBS repeat-containing protein [Polyangiaceae bacterium]|nr:VCBS repeat-containing protein [Polyangiaceae bacterium]